MRTRFAHMSEYASEYSYSKCGVSDRRSVSVVQQPSLRSVRLCVPVPVRMSVRAQYPAALKRRPVPWPHMGWAQDTAARWMDRVAYACMNGDAAILGCEHSLSGLPLLYLPALPAIVPRILQRRFGR